MYKKIVKTTNERNLMIENKNILFLCHSYTRYQKDSIDETSQYFKNVSVLVRTNPIAEISKYISIPALNSSRLDHKIDLKDKPSNLNIYSTPILYAPIDLQYKKLGEKHYKVVENTIKKDKILFDLVHAHFTWSSGYVGAKLKEKYGVPFIVTAHGYDIYNLPFKNKEWRSKIESVLNSADTVITVSNSNLECIKKLDVRTPVTVIPNGYREDIFYPIDTFECRKLLSLPSDKKIILSVGNLEEVKGHKYLVEAMSHVVKERKDVLCFIVGGGKLETQLEKQIKLAGLNNYVKLVGDKPHNEIPLWMNACDVFVLPSLSESFGIVQIEAMACGKPVVATRNGGSEEIIVSNDYGLICDPARPKELAENILLSLDKNWDSEKIVSYVSQFSLPVVSKRILDIYDLVLSN